MNAPVTLALAIVLVLASCTALPDGGWSVEAEGYAACPFGGEYGGRIACRVGRQSE